MSLNDSCFWVPHNWSSTLWRVTNEFHKSNHKVFWTLWMWHHCLARALILGQSSLWKSCNFNPYLVPTLVPANWEAHRKTLSSALFTAHLQPRCSSHEVHLRSWDGGWCAFFCTLQCLAQGPLSCSIWKHHSITHPLFLSVSPTSLWTILLCSGSHYGSTPCHD